MDAKLRDLLARVHELEIVARRNVSSLFAGNYLTTIPGRGLEFHEARKYVQGESIRRIDWKMTARLGFPHVRTFLEERQREVFIALDVSPSMATGWQEKTKLEVAVETAATLALSAVNAGDRIGFVTFSDQVLEFDRPRGGKKQLFRSLKAFAQALDRPPEPCLLSDPRCAIHAMQRFRSRSFVVFLISDFIDHDVPEDLKYLKQRHDVSLIQVYDPLEYASTELVRLPAYSPEGRASISAISPGLRARAAGASGAGSLEEIVGYLSGEAVKYGIQLSSLATDQPVNGALLELFQAKRRRLNR